MNLPNKLTVLRIVLTLVFLLFLFGHNLTSKILAFLTFVIASLTDVLDGYLAKRNDQVTNFGKLMDPIADKILVLSAFLAFVEMRLIPAWMVVIIIFRETAITGLRALALAQGKVIPADDGGKHKTVSQMFSVFAILIFLIFKEAGVSLFSFWTEKAESSYKDTIFVLMIVTVTLTLISGISYLVKNKEVYANAKAR